MGKESPNHEYDNAEAAMPRMPTSPQAYRQSAFAAANALASARRDSQKQLSKPTPAQEPTQTHGSSLQQPHPPPLTHPPAVPELTDDEIRRLTADTIRQDLCRVIWNRMEPAGQHAAWCFTMASLNPPITLDSLAELDISRTVQNPKLRYDVNFDRELHFRPNLDGSKGKLKLREANVFWKAVEAELVAFVHLQSLKAQEPSKATMWNRAVETTLVRLRNVFIAVRDILKTLVPPCDQAAVTERLDVDHMLQEIMNGVCDLVDVANWLAKMMKTHCAPMRDAAVDMMQAELCAGAAETEPLRLVNALRLLMNLLENMKLDVANHQIRHMRPTLIHDSFKFLRRYNMERIVTGRANAVSAKRWLGKHVSDLSSNQSRPTPLEAFTAGVLIDTVFSDPGTMPSSTFALDLDRLRALRTDVHGTIYHAICREVLTEIAGPTLRGPDLEKASMMLHTSVSAIVGGHGRFIERLDNVAVEIVRTVLTAEGRDSSFDSDLLDLAERKLKDYLHPNSTFFQVAAKHLTEYLNPKLQSRVKNCIKLSPLDLQSALLSAEPSGRVAGALNAAEAPLESTLEATKPSPEEDLIRRFTHIIVLHWRVWADLVYLVDFEPADQGALSTCTRNGATSSATSSPTSPTSPGQFPAGHKWSPVKATATEVCNGPHTLAPAPSTENPSASADDTESSEEDPSAATARHSAESA